jgi:hypothetical protein
VETAWVQGFYYYDRADGGVWKVRRDFPQEVKLCEASNLTDRAYVLEGLRGTAFEVHGDLILGALRF